MYHYGQISFDLYWSVFILAVSIFLGDVADVCALGSGRPVAIFERDFDTDLPDVDDPEELELWQNHASPSLQGDDFPHKMDSVTSYTISCFNESAKLCKYISLHSQPYRSDCFMVLLAVIMGMIIQAIYAIRSVPSRHAEFAKFDKTLSKWYLELPEHLSFDPAAPKNPCPAPPILTLHMQYWCTVLLLHRPLYAFFSLISTKLHHRSSLLRSIRHINADSNKQAASPAISSPKEGERGSSSRKNYDMCVQAANHITSIGKFASI